jgi:hypothetical protein
MNPGAFNPHDAPTTIAIVLATFALFAVVTLFRSQESSLRGRFNDKKRDLRTAAIYVAILSAFVALWPVLVTWLKGT